MSRSKSPSKTRPLVHASGKFRERALAWWSARHTSKVTGILVKGDGYLAFHWDDGKEDGAYSVPIETVLKATAADYPQSYVEERGTATS